MALTNTDLVTELYIGYYNRAPDPAGLQFWLTSLNNGASLTQVANAFANSSESLALYPFLSLPSVVNAGTFVTQVYNNLLNRAPDAAGQAFWTAQLQAGTVTPGSFILAIEQSVNMQTGTADAVTLASKVTVGEDYVTRIAANNVPFTQASAHAAMAPVSGIGNSPTTPAEVTAGEAVTSAYITNPTGGATTNLSTGIDSPTVTNSAQIAGTFNGTGATFTPGDQIIAPAGTTNATLSVSDLGGAAETATVNATTIPGATVTNVANLIINASQPVFANTASSPEGFTGLTSLTVNDAGGSTVKAAGTTAIKVTDTAQATGVETIDGGSSVSLTTSGGTSGTIGIGATTAPTGAITVNAGYSVGTGITGGAITVKGGTVDTVTSTMASQTAGLGADATIGAISVTGTATTTSVSVTQSAALAGAAAVTPTANTSNAVAATKGIIDGAVTIADANAANSTTATAAGLGGTITSVTLNNYGASSISSAALNSLTLSGTGGTLATLEAGSTAATNTTLALNLGGGSLGALTDSSNQFKTVNAALTANTTLGGITDTALRTLAISGTGVLALTAVNTALTSITLAGAAGLKANVSALAGVTSISAAGTTGADTLTLNATTQGFVGGSGQDIITIGADAQKTITGGSGTTDELVLTADGATYVGAGKLTTTNVTGFEVLGVNTATAATTYDLSKLTGFTSIDVIGSGTTSTTFTKVTAGTALQIDAATASIIYNTADASGATDSVSVNLHGTPVTAANGGGTAGFTTTALTLADINGTGIGNVTINSDASVFQGLQTITTLTDNALSNLAITGTGSLSIGAAATTATTLTISDNGTGTSATADGIAALTATGDHLGSISYSGTHNFTIGLIDNVANLTITDANTGTTGVLTVTHSDANLVGLTLNGSVALTESTSETAGLTVTGGSDNAAVSLTLSGVTGSNAITLGNGADTVAIGSLAGIQTVNLGTGVDQVTFAGSATSTAVDNVTFAAHTAADNVTVGLTGSNFATAVGAVITGGQLNDIIHFSADGAQALTVLSAVTAGASAGATITAIESAAAAAQGDVAYSVFGGNTYVAEAHGAAASAANITVIEIMGVHTFTAGTGQLTLLS